LTGATSARLSARRPTSKYSSPPAQKCAPNAARALELAARGERADYGAILADIGKRDARDSGRAAAPLRAAPDAALLDTSRLGVEAAFAEAVRIVEERRGERRTP
jgi:cytidylate kinase